MSHDQDAGRPVQMNHERPLDALLPDLAEANAPVPFAPVHQRVLEVVGDDGSLEWLLICWQDPGGPKALHTALQPVVEATLLSALSQPATAEQIHKRYSGIRLVFFGHVPQIQAATRAFGFREADHDADLDWLPAVHAEAELVGLRHLAQQPPTSVWQADIAWPQKDLGQKLAEIQKMAADRMGDDLWGLTPGGPSKLFANYMEQVFQQPITPDLDGLSTIELLLVQRQGPTGDVPGPVRWIPPLCFQALADFIGVLASGLWQVNLQWAVCEQDPLGLYPPPHFRVVPDDGAKPYFVPIGMHLLRWCVMPLQPGEVVPTLSAWMVDQFGPLPGDTP